MFENLLLDVYSLCRKFNLNENLNPCANIRSSGAYITGLEEALEVDFLFRGCVQLVMSYDINGCI